MFQSFDPPPAGNAGLHRLDDLRNRLKRAALDGFLVPRADEHMSEYVPPCAERLSWISGFTGSAGIAAITAKSAALFVDGRYVVQAPAQVDTASFDVLQIPQNKLQDWLIKTLQPGATVGFDPWLHTINQIEQLHRALQAKDISLKPVAKNPVDLAWGADRPKPPKAPVEVQPLRLAGQSAADKIKKLQSNLKAQGQDAAILTMPDSICWLLNIRGSDVAHNPVVLAFAIVPASGKLDLFLDPGKLTAKSRAHLKGTTHVFPPEELAKRIAALKSAKKIVRLAPASAAWWFFAKLGGRPGGRPGGKSGQSPRAIARGDDPCLLPKAIKNVTEIAGSRAAHQRDGIAMTRFLAWLDDAAKASSRTGSLDEITAAKRLEALRAETDQLKDISFDTISGAGADGAIVHYRVTEASNRKLRAGELYLVDSGAQYVDGTTDITRTIAIGKPSAEMRRRFTQVLKGHIAIATARFPKGTRGIDLDPFARRALWDAGLDFDHGTGHGVGSYLSVHEGPQSISHGGLHELYPGMILSNEPGYYKRGAYGIRIENLLLVTPAQKITGGERDMMAFETLTLAPIDQRLVEPKLLTADELQWLNAYHARVLKALKAGLDKATRQWLIEATKAIG